MPSHTPCLEVAVSTAKESTAFEELQRQTHRELVTFPGFISGIALRGLENKSMRADLILWESEESAHAAAEMIQRDERFSDFIQGIESVRHFAHYNGASLEAMNRLVASPIIEIAAYEVTLDRDVTQLRSQIYEALRRMEGASPQVAGVRTTNPSALLDLIGWQDKALHKAAPSIVMEQYPEVPPFFSSVERMELQALFEVVK